MEIKKLLLSSLLICSIFLSKAQDSSSSEYATMYIMRSSGTMGLGAFSAFIDDSLVCHLNNNRYSIHTLDPGLHKFQARADGKKAKKNIKSLEIKISPGQNYYLIIDVIDHYFTGTISLIEVTENTARKMFPKLKEDHDCGL